MSSVPDMPAPRTRTERSRRRRSMLLPWLIAAVLWFLPLGTPHLFDPDEGRYAEIPREMVASGDWVTPRLDTIKYFEKPALQYWATALAYEIFGLHAWSARLWSALSGFLGLILTWVLARRLYGERAAALAATIQGSSLLYLALARITTLDMSLCFSLQIAMTALVMLVQPEPQSQSQSQPRARGARAMRWPLLLGLGVALAVLSKGLIGILIPGAVAALFMLIHRDWRLLLRAQPWWSIAVLLALAAPWFVLVSHRNPGFAHFFFVFEHFQRYLSREGFDRYQPFWFFVPVLALGLLPWTGLLPAALRDALRAARGGERASSLLLIWAGFVLAFFSLSQSKLMPYILPMFPSLALLCGRTLARLPAPRFALQLRAVAAFAAGVGVLVLLLWRLPGAAALAARAGTPSILGFAAAFLLLALCAAIGARLCRRGGVLAGAAAAALGAVLLTQAALLAADRLPRMRTLVELTQQLRPWLRASTPLYCVNQYPQPLPFYLRRPCTLVGYRGELDFGLQQEPGRAIPDLAGFARAWRQQSDAAAILLPGDYQTLEALGVPMRVIYTAPTLIAVVRQ